MLLVVLVLHGVFAAETSAAPPPGYSVQKSGAVELTFPTSAESEARELLAAVGQTWDDLAGLLGVRVAPDLDLRVARNPEEMQALAPEGARLPGYASAVAFPERGVVLLSLTEPRSFLRPDMRKLLVHELSHVALHRAVGGAPVPRWFSEGVAVHQAGERSIARIQTLWNGVVRGQTVPLRRLDERFGQHHGEVDLAYAQSADLVAFMLDGEGDGLRFRSLIAELRKGEPLEAAFGAAYGLSLEQLEQTWRAHVARRYGRWPSVLMGLSAVWALSALLLLVGYIRTRKRHRTTLERWALEEAPIEQDAPIVLVPVVPPTPAPAARPRAADEVLDGLQDERRRDRDLPTVVHEGRSYTLH